MSPAIEVTTSHALPMSELLDEGNVDPSACVAAGLRALACHLPPGMAVSSLTLDLSPLSPPSDEQIDFAVRIEKTTRSVVFTSIEARTAAGATVFGLRALCSRPGPVPSAASATAQSGADA